MTRRHYRPRVYVRAPVGCVGCSLLWLLGVLLAAYVGVLLAGLAL